MYRHHISHNMYCKYIFIARAIFALPASSRETTVAVAAGVWPRVIETFPAMRLSLFSDYSLRVLMYAALKGDVFQVEEVATAYGISRHHLVKVVHHLAKLGYLDTRRGRGGGIRLGRPAAAIRVGKLVRETEADPVLVECFDPATNTCRLSGNCRLKGVLAEAMAAFYAKLDEQTLEDLVRSPLRSRMSKVLLGGK